MPIQNKPPFTREPLEKCKYMPPLQREPLEKILARARLFRYNNRWKTERFLKFALHPGVPERQQEE